MLRKRNKNDNFSIESLFENFFGSNPFKDFEDDFAQDQDLEVETFEVIKNNVKTIITCKFNKQGFMVSYGHQSTSLPTKQDEDLNYLMVEKDKAVELEDYSRAAELQKKIKELEDKTKTNS